MNFFSFQPIYQERIWGGRAFEQFKRDCLPEDGNFGESWEICDRPEANSRIKSGPLAGFTLRELIRLHGNKIMGTEWPSERPFPILVKWLDCRERLSLQVHPPEHIARHYGGESKTETWYVANAESGAGLFCGFKQGVTREMFERALQNNTVNELIHRAPVAKGDSLHTPSGRIHAIDAGCLILEIQQNSDTTYRVYDWGRPRQLHIEASLLCIDFKDYEPTPLKASGHSQLLIKCPNYRLRCICLNAGGTINFEAGYPRILSLVEGQLEEITCITQISYGENLLLPACSSFKFKAITPAKFLVTDEFA